MAVTTSSFLAEFDEFSSLSTTLVDAKLAEAVALHSETAWGDLYDFVVKYATADALAMTPAGLPMAIRTDDGETIYSARLRRVYQPRNSRRGAVL